MAKQSKFLKTAKKISRKEGIPLSNSKAILGATAKKAAKKAKRTGKPLAPGQRRVIEAQKTGGMAFKKKGRGRKKS